VKRRYFALPALAALTVGMILAIGASGASLPGSKFEIDLSSNLKVDTPGNLDWANVSETRGQDTASGQNDSSYGGGTKEDTVCPAAGTGSIPNNKSDLLTFGAYTEAEAGGAGWLNLFWRRVNDPSGTTLMDFELNHAAAGSCTNGSPNALRTAGDILIEYSIDQGGAVATITAREWNGSAWGDATALPGQAIGSINNVPIPAAESDGLSTTPLASRTFGEMSLDLDFIFDPGTCDSFGSAMLKSRSSDAFNSQLKDYIAPIGVNIANCASVIIHKQTVPDGDTQEFGFTRTYVTDPAGSTTFSLKDGETQDDSDIALFGSDKTVSEDAVTAAGYSFVNVDCSAGNVVPDSIVGQVVTFDLDAASDVLECTFNNKKEEGSIKVVKESIKGNTGLAGAKFTVAGAGGPYLLETNSDGEACVDGLAFGDYTVTETDAPGGYALDNGDPVDINVGANSECPDGLLADTLTFSDTPLTDIDASANSQDDGPGGTLTTITCVDADGDDVGNSPSGNVHDPSVSADDLVPGTYTCTLVIDP
jgi:Prealbumin-like fold domain